MARTTAAEVKGITETSLTDGEVDNFIAIATLIIDDYATRCTKAGTDRLQKMEAVLTAHLIKSQRERSLVSRSFGDSSRTYSGQSGMGLEASPYGQQLKLLDPCGIIADMDKRVASTELLE